ncbi:radical SAM protein [Halostella litorea]|uniref:radical SAM protein n=1 Tax=Halostella litorea TaxID=2528831 RepID=UPI0010927471|nr:radical SAM protein [Halostella litorea]
MTGSISARTDSQQDGVYPRLTPEHQLIKMPDVAVVNEALPADNRAAHVENNAKGDDDFLWVDLDAATVLERCDGTRSVSELLDELAETSAERRSVREFLGTMVETGCLDVHEEPQSGDITVKGSTEYYLPIHLSMELTDACNLTCDHCYRVAEPKNGTFMEYDDAISLVDEMADASLTTVELTGGEATLHPRFTDIATYCAERLNLVGILTNGMLIEEEMLDALEPYRDSVMFSVSLDSHDPEYHNEFRGSERAYDLTTEGIDMITDRGFVTRVSMSVTPANASHMEDLASLAIDLGADMFSFSPVMPFGRALEDYHWTTEDVKDLSEQADRVREKHGDSIPTIDMENFTERHEARSHNCGAGWKTVTVGPDGEVRPCVMAEDGRDGLGTLDFEDPTAFFEAVGDVTKAFHDRTPPNKDICGDCSNLHFCRNCILRSRATVENDFTDVCRYGPHVRMERLLDGD